VPTCQFEWTNLASPKNVEQGKFPKINNKIYSTRIYQQIEKFAYLNDQE
jgi:hypothetical protein